MMVSVLTILLGACSSQDSNDLPVYEEIPPFSLIDQRGQAFTGDDLRDKVVVANFVFTNCTESCPTLSPRLGQIQERLKEDAVLGREVILLSFSVDPKHDTPEILLSYAERHGADYDAWRFLTGPPDVMHKVITDGFKLAFGEVRQRNEHRHGDGSVHIHEYNVFHTNRVVLGDKAGRVRAYYDGIADWDMAKVLKDVRQLLD